MVSDAKQHDSWGFSARHGPPIAGWLRENLIDKNG